MIPVRENLVEEVWKQRTPRQQREEENIPTREQHIIWEKRSELKVICTPDNKQIVVIILFLTRGLLELLHWYVNTIYISVIPEP